jgi:hypothetical protein
VFLIPVIPLQWGEAFVECQRCKAAYREAVLQAPTNKQFAYMLALAARAMYAKAVAAGFAHSEHMVERAVDALRPLTGPEYNEANLVADMEAFRGHGLSEYVVPLAENMALAGREGLVAGLVTFAHSDGAPPPEVEAVIQDSAAGLQLTSTHLAGIVATVTGASRPEVP